MRLSVITDEISQDLKHALTVCHDLGITTVELRAIDGKNIVFHDMKSVLRIKALLQAGGFDVCSIASPFLKCSLWKTEIAADCCVIGACRGGSVRCRIMYRNRSDALRIAATCDGQNQVALSLAGKNVAS